MRGARLLLLLLVAGCRSLPVEKPDTSVVGCVIDGYTGRWATNAVVSIQRRGKVDLSTRTDAHGRFCLTNVAPAQVDKDGYPIPYVLSAFLPGSRTTAAAIATQITAFAGVQFTLRLPPALPLRVLVTDLQHRPLPGVQVFAAKVWYPARNTFRREAFPWKDRGDTNLTGQDGTLRLPNIPLTGDVRIVARKDGFADTVIAFRPPQSTKRAAPSRYNWTPKRPVTSMVSSNDLTILLSRETTIEGTVYLGDEPFTGGTNWIVKAQSCRAPWIEYDQWRFARLDAHGRFLIRNVPSLEVLNDRSLGLNIDINNIESPAPGITATYVPPKVGWDLMVTLNRNGRTECWISCVEMWANGLKYTEGDRIRHDMRFEPMALVRGTVKGRPGERVYVSYQNPKSSYQPWVVPPTDAGRFEIPVLTGDVTLLHGNKSTTITGLQPHEVREVHLTAD